MLQSQATRLDEYSSYTSGLPATYGVITLHDVLFKATYAGAAAEAASIDYNSDCKQSDLQFELFPLHSPLLRESLLVSFPPLSYMLKFSG